MIVEASNVDTASPGAAALLLLLLLLLLLDELPVAVAEPKTNVADLEVPAAPGCVPLGLASLALGKTRLVLVWITVTDDAVVEAPGMPPPEGNALMLLFVALKLVYARPIELFSRS